MATLTFHVQGTHCHSCKVLIEDVCSEISGITASDVDPESGEVRIDYEGELDKEKLKSEIEALGDYKVHF